MSENVKRYVLLEIGGKTYELNPNFKNCSMIEQELAYSLQDYFTRISNGLSPTLIYKRLILKTAIEEPIDIAELENWIIENPMLSTEKVVEFFVEALRLPRLEDIIDELEEEDEKKNLILGR